jgi:hypothetical protein
LRNGEIGEQKKQVLASGKAGVVRGSLLLGSRHQFEVLDSRRAVEEGADDGAPFGEQGRLAETHGVVFQRVPEDLQDVALLAFDAAVDLEALKPLGWLMTVVRPRVMASSNAAFWPA